VVVVSLLEVRDLRLQFGGVVVLDDVSLDVEEHEILAVIGPNGAGKTALLNCISGIYRPQRGSVALAGQQTVGKRAYKAARLGIGRSFQHLELFSHLTVAENLLVARHARMRSGVLRCALFWGPSRREEIEHRRAVEEIVDFFELWPYRHKLASSLPFGVQKLVGVARAMASEPRLLLLDEPGSGLTRDEKEDLARFLLRLRYDWDVPILWIEHDIKMVMDLAERIQVLDRGSTIARGTPAEVRRDPAVVRAYLGDRARSESGEHSDADASPEAVQDGRA
jgi:branched-chain amino acid transport system ATP-binding protein